MPDSIADEKALKCPLEKNKELVLWYKPYDDKDVYAAIGDSGNIIYVNKEENVSVGMTGTFKPRIFDRVEFIEQKVLPSLNE